MDCGQITQKATAAEILQSAAGSRMQQLFNCIYKLFYQSFMRWVNKCYAESGGGAELRKDAEDAFQSGMTEFVQKTRARTFTLKNSLKTTVYSFGLYQLMCAYRKEIRRRALYRRMLRFFFEEEMLAAERDALLDKREKALMEALNKLSPQQKEMVMMRYFESLSSNEIAERLHVSPGHVDNEMHKARKQLRELLCEKPAMKEKKEWN